MIIVQNREILQDFILFEKAVPSTKPVLGKKAANVLLIEGQAAKSHTQTADRPYILYLLGKHHRSIRHFHDNPYPEKWLF